MDDEDIARFDAQFPQVPGEDVSVVYNTVRQCCLSLRSDTVPADDTPSPASVRAAFHDAAVVEPEPRFKAPHAFPQTDQPCAAGKALLAVRTVASGPPVA